MMNIIKNDCTNEIIIKNSRFICFLKYISTDAEAFSIIEDIKNKYKDSTHVTYAFRTLDKQKFSDDGEPGGTAGAPIMEVILKNDIVNILAIVVRYFGGIKLGAGGLIRAYSKSVRETLLKTNLCLYIKYNYYEIISSYDNLKLLNTLTNNLDITDKFFGENITYKIKIKDELDNIPSLFKNTDIKIRKLN